MAKSNNTEGDMRASKTSVSRGPGWLLEIGALTSDKSSERKATKQTSEGNKSELPVQDKGFSKEGEGIAS